MKEDDVPSLTPRQMRGGGEETEFRLAPPRQVHVAGISLGVLAIKPDPNDRVALIGVYNPERKAPESHRMRAGDEVTVAGRLVRVDDVVTGPGGHVDLVVRWTAS
ncbi:MAG TPA: hypothetical protein VGO86_11000 [Candidatus Dormibacteraeota bacterium]